MVLNTTFENGLQVSLLADGEIMVCPLRVAARILRLPDDSEILPLVQRLGSLFHGHVIEARVNGDEEANSGVAFDYQALCLLAHHFDARRGTNSASWIEKNLRNLMTNPVMVSFWGCFEDTPNERQKSQQGKIYFVQSGPDGPIKIGFSRSHHNRFDHLQAHNARKLRLLALLDGTYEKEKEIHERFASIRLHGEWFEPAPKLLRFVNTLNRKAKGVNHG